VLYELKIAQQQVADQEESAAFNVMLRACTLEELCPSGIAVSDPSKQFMSTCASSTMQSYLEDVNKGPLGSVSQTDAVQRLKGLVGSSAEAATTARAKAGHFKDFQVEVDTERSQHDEKAQQYEDSRAATAEAESRRMRPSNTMLM